MRSDKNRLRFANSVTTRVETDFRPFKSLSKNGDINRLLQATSVTARTAISYHCSGQYAMRERVIGDDMFYCITQGKAEVYVNGQKYFLNTGQCAHFPRGVRHAAFAIKDAPFDVIAMHYDALVFGGLTLPRLLEFPAVFNWRDKSTFIAALEEMCRVYTLQPAGWKVLLNAMTTQFLWNLVDEEIQLQSPQTTLPWRNMERLLPALTLMREQLKTPLTIEQLAAKCHLSPAQFRRVFQDAMGTSPLRYLQQRRLEKACQLLLHSSNTIEAISAQVGYEDASYFSHTFRRVMGLPPGKYRKLNVL
jgi:AraC-like DNA-binding protein/mannose-6-phosphate isomerase-like protein (cupin superfamily)